MINQDSKVINPNFKVINPHLNIIVTLGCFPAAVFLGVYVDSFFKEIPRHTTILG